MEQKIQLIKYEMDHESNCENYKRLVCSFILFFLLGTQSCRWCWFALSINNSFKKMRYFCCNSFIGLANLKSIFLSRRKKQSIQRLRNRGKEKKSKNFILLSKRSRVNFNLFYQLRQQAGTPQQLAPITAGPELGVNFAEGGNRSARRKLSKSG